MNLPAPTNPHIGQNETKILLGATVTSMAAINTDLIPYALGRAAIPALAGAALVVSGLIMRDGPLPEQPSPRRNSWSTGLIIGGVVILVFTALSSLRLVATGS